MVHNGPFFEKRLMRGTSDEIRDKGGKVKQRILREVVRRVVAAADPDKIILFGSAARGEMGPDSDLDLLVIKSGKFNHWRLLTNIYRGLGGDHAAVDVVLATTDDIQRYGDSPCLVLYPALREGKVVYASKTPAAQ